MAPKKGENSKKAAGNARKAEAAAAKKSAADKVLADAEDREWSKGSKSNAKKEADDAKKAEAARKKKERDEMLKEEMATLPTKPKGTSTRGQDKVAGRRAGKIDDFLSNKDPITLNASNIDDALDALSISGAGAGSKGAKDGVERHPERRYKAALLAYEERRLPEVKEEHKGLRLNQMKDLIKKEFDKSEENPFNQVTVRHNATRDEITAVKQGIKNATERRLASN
ncbi:uncharacterized protein V1516DRAFT_681530, partial [Lipomyces oligophaga]|uniref:uncharacterized protein n=1 Tax=Lipomyces oligophaga TaxID=45792 RepID=UPI0034CD6718